MTTVIDELLQRLVELAAADAAGDAEAHSLLLKGISSLQLAVETPLETTSRLNFQPLQNICIQTAIECGWLKAIASRNGDSVTAAKLSAITGVDELFIIRIMRVLTCIGLCKEVGHQTYAANAITHFKVRQGSIGAEKHHFADFKLGARLIDWMRGPGIHQFADGPGEMTLFEYAHGSKSIFDYLEKDPEQKQAFDDYMKSRRLGPQWFDIYPVATKFANARKDAEAILLVDIGGGPGQEVDLFKQRYPDIPGLCVLQDLPLTIERIDKLHKGIERMVYNFFEPQPVKGIKNTTAHRISVAADKNTVPGARSYFLRNVLHNWSDAQSAKILLNVVEAMDPEYSTLLIDDYVMPESNVELRAAEMDILMWMHTSGLERTERQWQSLCKSVGLEIVKIWSAARGGESVIELERI